MRSRNEGHAGKIAAFALVIALVTGCGHAWAQASIEHNRKEPALPARPSWQDCGTAGPDVASGLEAARHLLQQSWLAQRGSQFSAYTMPGEKRSPFDLSPREPDSASRDGMVEARPPRCIYSTATGTDSVHHVRFISPYYRFYEHGQGWSPPLRDGLMLEVKVTRTGAEWTAVGQPSEQTILLAEQRPHRPDLAKLPSDAEWAAPMLGCGRRKTWDGRECVPRKRR
ncbi:MAG: hypothetical protein AB7L90_20765 [Hyphomicrobiaceae bacterium]